MNIADLRRDYAQGSLDLADVDPDPIRQFGLWLEAAIQAQLPEPTAMSVATVDAHGRPSSRILLLKGFDAAGFVFYTNLKSRKSRDLGANRRVALLFHWIELERELRIEGHAELISDAEADRYFDSRPLGSRIGAIASPQSEEIANRAVLEAMVAKTQTDYARYGESPPRPAFWGGYRVEPDYLEFWQGRPSRLHDRIAYRRHTDRWQRFRLAP